MSQHDSLSEVTDDVCMCVCVGSGRGDPTHYDGSAQLSTDRGAEGSDGVCGAGPSKDGGWIWSL